MREEVLIEVETFEEFLVEYNETFWELSYAKHLKPNKRKEIDFTDRG